MPAPATVPAPTATQCASCGTALHGAYCHACGEKRLDHHDYALPHFLEHAVDTLTHFDFKVLKGAWSLIARPGLMTRDVLAGRRVTWPKPLQLFLIVNLVYAFVAHQLGMQVLNTPLKYHYGFWYGDWAEARMTALAAEQHLSPELLAARFDALANTLAKSLVFVFIPLLAAGLTGLLWAKRRYFLEHVVTATHLTSQILLVQLLMIGPLALGQILAQQLGSPLSYRQADLASVALMLLGLTAAFAPLLIRTYALRRGPGLAAGLAVALLFFLLLMHVYRFVLFVVASWLL
ncbi:DUF3667 domain-containing protein [Hymenobacter sp. B81]|uniref:DUF3667 domain-containing protein n=1 Tax=Hymenobacter sp. B81 TaxID=3344878 RepID=UPI0037DD402A